LFSRIRIFTIYTLSFTIPSSYCFNERTYHKNETRTLKAIRRQIGLSLVKFSPPIHSAAARCRECCQGDVDPGRRLRTRLRLGRCRRTRRKADRPRFFRRNDRDCEENVSTDRISAGRRAKSSFCECQL